MLKITITESPTETRFILEGRLVGPWVEELRAVWMKSERDRDSRACVVDLNNVTFIDKSGERLLQNLWKTGAQFFAKDLYTRAVVEQLER